jgi:methylated-DNA-protein-cysteine methyltransferase related protein
MTGRRARPAATRYDRIYAIVRRIPRGRVATYGQVAMLAGLPGRARMIGYALAALSDGSGVPWQRVVNAQGRVSPRAGGSGHEVLQAVMLRREGVRFRKTGVIPLAVFRWHPRLRGR